MTTTVHPASDGGAILVFELGPGFVNDDHFQETKPSLNAALSGIEQHAFSGPLHGIRFTGTNTILEPGRLIFIKDKNRSEWTDDAAAKDVAKVVPNSSEKPA